MTLTGEVLHRQIQHLLGGPSDAVDLVDEATSCSTRLDSIAARSPARSSAGPDVTRSEVPQLGGDDHRQRRLAQPRRADRDVIGAPPRVFGALDDQLQLFGAPAAGR